MSVRATLLLGGRSYAPRPLRSCRLRGPGYVASGRPGDRTRSSPRCAPWPTRGTPSARRRPASWRRPASPLYRPCVRPKRRRTRNCGSRAAAVAEKIDRAVRSKRLLVAPTLALKLDRVPLQQAVTEVSQKTGLRFVLEQCEGHGPPAAGQRGHGRRAVLAGRSCLLRRRRTDRGRRPAPGHTRPTADSERPAPRLHEPPLRARPGGPDPPGRRKVQCPPAATGQALRVRALPAGHAQNKYDAATGEVTFHLAVDAAPTLSLQEVFGVEVRRAVADDRRAMAPVYSAPTPSAACSRWTNYSSPGSSSLLTARCA